jgi:branched-chain amino acid transport system substrate-binding protein
MNHVLKIAPVAIAAAVALAACGKKEEPAKAAPAPAKAVAPAASTVKIGHVAPLTGGIAHLGKDNENGARMAVDEINAAGGIDVGGAKVKFELVAEDDKADPKEGTLAAQKIVDAGVVAVVGGLGCRAASSWPCAPLVVACRAAPWPFAASFSPVGLAPRRAALVLLVF